MDICEEDANYLFYVKVALVSETLCEVRAFCGDILLFEKMMLLTFVSLGGLKTTYWEIPRIN